MKTKNSFLIFPMVALLVVSCSDDIPSEPHMSTTRSNEGQISGETARSLDQALEYADEFFSQFEGNAKTRASRTVESVEYITTGPRTRAGNAGVDTLFYLVNYASEQGFALLGRPAQSYDIYAISTEGRLRMSDTIKNKGLAEFIDLATLHAAAANNIVLTPSDTLSVTWYYNITRQVKPLLHANISVWNQEAPFNKYCPMVNGNRGVTGCGPVAVAMLMAHYKWPDKMNNKAINWDAIVEGNDYDKIARLIEDLAAPQYLDAQYKQKDEKGDSIYYSRSTYAFLINPTMNKWKYEVSSAFNDVSFKTKKEEAFDFMQNGYQLAPPSPILMTGRNVNNPIDGHIWVVDGFIERTKTNAAIDRNPFASPIEVDPLLHIAWGWGGYGNGYYAYLQDSNLLEKDPQVGPIMNTQFGSLYILGRYVKRYTD